MVIKRMELGGTESRRLVIFEGSLCSLVEMFDKSLEADEFFCKPFHSFKSSETSSDDSTYLK